MAKKIIGYFFATHIRKVTKWCGWWLQVEMMTCVPSRVLREDYLMCLLNRNPDVDIRLLESVKFLMMEKALCVYRQMEWRRKCGYPQPAEFWLFTALCPDRLFRQKINPLGDSVKAGPVWQDLYYTSITVHKKLFILQRLTLAWLLLFFFLLFILICFLKLELSLLWSFATFAMYYFLSVSFAWGSGVARNFRQGVRNVVLLPPAFSCLPLPSLCLCST